MNTARCKNRKKSIVRKVLVLVLAILLPKYSYWYWQ